MRVLPNERWISTDRLSERPSRGIRTVDTSGVSTQMRLEGWVLKGWRRQGKYIRLRGSALSVHECESSIANEVHHLHDAKLVAYAMTKHVTIRPLDGKGVTFFLDGDGSKFKAWVSALRLAISAEFSDRYEILNSVGRGLSGSVCIARKRTNGLIYAVKITDQSRMTDKELRLARTELRVLLSVRHGQNVNLEEVYTNGNVFFLVTEYLSGGNLEELLAHVGTLDEATARPLMRALLRAVFQLHDLDVIHRDVKLENIMLATDDIEDGVKLVDFGMCAVLDDANQNTNLQAKNYALTGVLGTWDYLAPEVLMKRSYGAPVDLWACGLCLHKLLTGEMPDTSLAEVPGRRHQRDMLSPELLLHGSGSLISFLESLLERDPVRRLTAWEALMHPWLKDAKTAPKVSNSQGVLNGFHRAFQKSAPNSASMSLLLSEASTAVANGIGPREEHQTNEVEDDQDMSDFMGADDDNVFADRVVASNNKDEHVWTKLQPNAITNNRRKRNSNVDIDRKSNANSRGFPDRDRSVSIALSRLRMPGPGKAG